MLEFIKRHKIATLVTINLVALIIAIVIIIIHLAKTATIDINVAPNDATITLNGRKYDNNTSHDVLPGNYHVKIAMDGMQTKEYDISLERNGFIRIWDYLLDEKGGFDYYLTHPDDMATLAELDIDQKVKDIVNYYNRITSIRDMLPLEYYERFEVDKPLGVFIEEDPNDCDSKALCLVVYGGEKNRDIALKLIKEAGYDPEDYGIRFERE